MIDDQYQHTFITTTFPVANAGATLQHNIDYNNHEPHLYSNLLTRIAHQRKIPRYNLSLVKIKHSQMRLGSHTHHNTIRFVPSICDFVFIGLNLMRISCLDC